MMTMTATPHKTPVPLGERAGVGNRVLARNTFFNLAGLCVPAAIAILAIPRIVTGLGTARFGLLTLAWMVIGYYSLFDLGLSRALTQTIAERLGNTGEVGITGLFWTGLVLMSALGGVGALLVSFTGPWLVGHVLRVPYHLRVETIRAIYILALCLPFVISTAGLRGVLEAGQRFELSSTAWAALGVSNFLGPVLFLRFSHTLTAMVAVLALCRLLAWVAHLVLCLAVFPSLRRFQLSGGAVRPLFAFGSWMTVSSLLNPILSGLDRVLIGAILSVSAVAYYAVPYEVVMRVLVLPAALVGVIFPAFATTYRCDGARTSVLFGRATKVVFLSMFPVILAIVAFSNYGLNLWLGAEFAHRSTRVLQLLAAGVFFNSFGYVASALVQGAGRPDLTAKLHLLELPFYVPAVLLLIRAYGIEGAAWAWVARIAADTVALFLMTRRIFPDTASVTNRMSLLVAVGLAVLGVLSLPQPAWTQAGLLLLVLAGFGLAGWFLVLAPDERVLLRRGLKPVETGVRT